MKYLVMDIDIVFSIAQYLMVSARVLQTGGN